MTSLPAWVNPDALKVLGIEQLQPTFDGIKQTLEKIVPDLTDVADRYTTAAAQVDDALNETRRR